jgi:hypothetical protein
MSKQAYVSSRFLSKREIAALVRIGDIMLPGDGKLPSFSQTGCIQCVDDLLLFMEASDRASLQVLLRVCSFLPSALLKVVLWLCQTRRGASLRLGELGFKGLVVSLYYSNKTNPEYAGPKPLDVIGFELQRMRDQRLT